LGKIISETLLVIWVLRINSFELLESFAKPRWDTEQDLAVIKQFMHDQPFALICGVMPLA
jgi:hypothetical protein